MFNLHLEKVEEPEINCQHSLNHRESKGFQKNIYLHVIDYTKAFDCVDHNKLWKTLKDTEISGHLTCLLRNLMQFKKQELEPSFHRLKRLPAMRETWVQSLGQEDPLEKEMATHFSILAWRIPWMEEPGGLQSTGSQRVRHD